MGINSSNNSYVLSFINLVLKKKNSLLSIVFLKRSFLEILFDLINPSNAISGAFIFGPLISSDFKTTCFCRPSNKIISLLGVEKDEPFFVRNQSFIEKFFKTTNQIFS